MKRFLGGSRPGLLLDFLSYSFSVLALSFLVGLLHGFTANAASNFDNVINKVDKLEIKKSNYCGGGVMDKTSNYLESIIDSRNIYQNENNQSALDQLNLAYQKYQEQLDNDNATGYSIFTVNQTNSNQPGIIYILIGDGTIDFDTMSNSNLRSAMFRPDNSKYYVLAFTEYTTGQQDCSDNRLIAFGQEYSNGEGGLYNASWDATKNALAINLSYSPNQPDDLVGWYQTTHRITYPVDYEGEEIPDTVDPGGGEKEHIRPNFTWALNNKNVKSHDYNTDLPSFTPDAGYSFVAYEVEWTLLKCTEWQDVGASCSSPTLANYKILPQDSDYSFDVSEYGDYTLAAQYLVKQCYRYESYPATPDYCFYIDLQSKMPQYDFTDTKVHLEINGQSKTGDTLNMTCDVAGFCKPDIEMCYTQPDFFSQITCRFNKQMNVGLINPSILAFKNLLTSFTVPNNPTCSIAISNVSIAPGKSFPLSTYSSKACSSAAQFRNSFPIAAILINFFLALSILYLIVGIINKLTNHNDTEMIAGVSK